MVVKGCWFLLSLLFLTWQSLYIMQPIHDDGRIATATTNPFTPRVTSQLTN
eukprot:UN07616